MSKEEINKNWLEEKILAVIAIFRKNKKMIIRVIVAFLALGIFLTFRLINSNAANAEAQKQFEEAYRVIRQSNRYSELMKVRTLLKNTSLDNVGTFPAAKADYYLASMLYVEKKYNLAFKKYTKACGSSKGTYLYISSLLGSADCLLQLKNYSGAVKVYTKIIQNHRHSGFAHTAYYKKALALIGLKKSGPALNALNKVIKSKSTWRRKAKALRLFLSTRFKK